MAKEKKEMFGIPVLFWMLRFAGMKIKGKRTVLYSFFQIILLVSYLLLSLFQIIYTLKMISHLEEFVTSAILSLSCLKGIVKYFLINWHEFRIDSIYHSFNVCYKKYVLHCKPESEPTLNEFNRFLKKFFYFYLFVVAGTAISWQSQTFLRTQTEERRNRTRIEIPDFQWGFHSDIWFPYPIRSPLVFAFSAGFLFFCFFWMIQTFVGFTITNLALFKYLEAHFYLLGLELKNSGDCHCHSMQENLKRCIKYHLEILRLIKEIEKVCASDIFYLSFSFVFAISLAGFLLTMVDKVILIKIICFLIWCIVELYVLLNAGNLAYFEALKLSENAYLSSWPQNTDLEVRLILLLIILRSNKNKPLKATYFIEISRETFASLMNSSFSYLTVLRNLD